jgi:hypothetical protein
LAVASSSVRGAFAPAAHRRDLIDPSSTPLSAAPTKLLAGTVLSFGIKSNTEASFPTIFELCNVINNQGFIQPTFTPAPGGFVAGAWRTVTVPLRGTEVQPTQADWGNMRRLELYCGAGYGKRCAFEPRDIKLVFPAPGTSGSEFLVPQAGVWLCASGDEHCKRQRGTPKRAVGR